MRFGAANIVILSFILSSCGVTVQDNIDYSVVSTADLWRTHSIGLSGKSLLLIEAELGARGQTSNGNDYLGKVSSDLVGKSRFARDGSNNEGKDCSDFSNIAVAQKFFLASGGPTLDPYNLDGDGDGFACEWGSKLKSISKSRARVTTYTPTRYYSPSCYTGARGGTYTITASGAKDYSGC